MGTAANIVLFVLGPIEKTTLAISVQKWLNVNQLYYFDARSFSLYTFLIIHTFHFSMFHLIVADFFLSFPLRCEISTVICILSSFLFLRNHFHSTLFVPQYQGDIKQDFFFFFSTSIKAKSYMHAFLTESKMPWSFSGVRKTPLVKMWRDLLWSGNKERQNANEEYPFLEFSVAMMCSFASFEHRRFDMCWERRWWLMLTTRKQAVSGSWWRFYSGVGWLPYHGRFIAALSSSFLRGIGERPGGIPSS